jgi:N,N'-diacetylchitobiose transport system permease protein
VTRAAWRAAANLTGLAVAAVVVFPIYWMVLSALKPSGEIQAADPLPWTGHPTLDHFRSALGVSGFARYFANSAIVASVVVVASALIAFLAAVALTRFQFRFRTVLLVMFLVAQMVPVEALTIPLFFLIRDLGRVAPMAGLNTLGSLMLVHLAFSLPFAIWMLRGFVAAVPESVLEAARIDGASQSGVLWRILFPLAAPGIAATSVFSFITSWNDFVFAKTFIIGTEHQTLPAALLVFFKPDENDWGGIMAASTLMTLPVLVFFVLVQRRLVAGLGGAVKD